MILHQLNGIHHTNKMNFPDPIVAGTWLASFLGALSIGWQAHKKNSRRNVILPEVERQKLREYIKEKTDLSNICDGLKREMDDLKGSQEELKRETGEHQTFLLGQIQNNQQIFITEVREIHRRIDDLYKK